MKTNQTKEKQKRRNKEVYINMKIKTGVFALALTMIANVTLAQYPPASHLATRWWQWALETPEQVNMRLKLQTAPASTVVSNQ